MQTAKAVKQFTSQHSTIEMDDFSEVHKEQLVMYNKIKDVAASKLHGNVEGFQFGLYELQEILNKDIESGKVKIIGKVDELFDSAMVSKPRSSNELCVFRNFQDKILYSEEFEIVIGSTRRMPTVSQEDYFFHTYIFATDKEKVNNFLTYINDTVREMYCKDYNLMLSNTQFGLFSEKIKVDKSYDRSKLYLEDDIKKEILFAVDSFFKNGSKIYDELGISYRRGILLYGKPGNGKTTLLKSISNSISSPVVYWQVSERSDSDSIAGVFERVSSFTPALLIIEDIDSLPAVCRSTFLNQLDGVKDNKGLFIIGTTNYPERIDPAMMNRAGRFDRTYEIKPPSKEIKMKYLKDKGFEKFASEEEIEHIAETTEGFSISLLNEIYNNAALKNVFGEKIDFDKIINEFKAIGDKQATGFAANTLDITSPKKVGFTLN